VSSLAEVRRRRNGNAPDDVSAGERIAAGRRGSGTIRASRGLRVAEGWRGGAGRRSQGELSFRLYREAVSFNGRFVYHADRLVVSSQETHCDWFLYSSGQRVEDDHRLCEGFDDGAKSWLAA
jgi:hypothetical protein